MCKALTMLPPSPHWGMTSTRLSGPLVGLVGSKNRSLRPFFSCSHRQCTGATLAGQIRLLLMDVGLIAGFVMLVLWAAGTFFLDAPGWINALLSVGVFVV